MPDETHTTNLLRTDALEIVRRLQARGFSAYWVGGCVRDSLLGKTPHDYDIATDAKPADVEAIFEHTIPVGRQFGIVVVILHEAQFQVAMFRAESDYTDGRRPDRVSFSDARGDAERRDFTINGLFLDPVTGQLHDWVGGEADLRARRVRTIGEPRERFGEDHLRLLRAVRFAAQLGFEIAPETWTAVQALAPKIKLISPERIRDELIKIFQPPHAARGLELLRESGLLAEVLPELAATITCEQSPDYHPEGTVFAHLAKMLGQLPVDAPPSLPWAVLMHDIAKPVTAARDPVSGHISFLSHETIGAEMAETILTRLRFPRKQIDEIVTSTRYHMQFKDAPKMRRATLRRTLLRPTISLELALHRLDCLGSTGNLATHELLKRELTVLNESPSLTPPLLKGEDLIALGVEPGPRLGRLLAEIRDKQLAEELVTREAALEWANARVAEVQPRMDTN